jgi:hypothetical protein
MQKRIYNPLLSPESVGAAPNDVWGTTIAPEAWKAVLEPPTARTLRDVCELIALQAQRTLVLEAGYLGASSRSAAAFLAVRSMLLRAGADAATIRPSAPAADVARRFPYFRPEHWIIVAT